MAAGRERARVWDGGLASSVSQVIMLVMAATDDGRDTVRLEPVVGEGADPGP